MKTKKYENILETMPVGLKKNMLHVILQCKGRENRISKQQVASLLHMEYNATTDRLMRITVNVLRKEGYLILSDSGGAGYWYADSFDEVNDTVAEMKSRASDLLEQSAILLSSAEREYSGQMTLM